VFLNFTPAESGRIPARQMERFAKIDTLPCGRVALPYESLEEYLASLSKATRKDIRRKLKAAVGVRVVRTVEPGPWLDRIYELYKATVERADMSLGTHRP